MRVHAHLALVLGLLCGASAYTVAPCAQGARPAGSHPRCSARGGQQDSEDPTLVVATRPLRARRAAVGQGIGLALLNALLSSPHRSWAAVPADDDTKKLLAGYATVLFCVCAVQSNPRSVGRARPLAVWMLSERMRAFHSSWISSTIGQHMRAKGKRLRVTACAGRCHLSIPLSIPPSLSLPLYSSLSIPPSLSLPLPPSLPHPHSYSPFLSPLHPPSISPSLSLLSRALVHVCISRVCLAYL